MSIVSRVFPLLAALDSSPTARRGLLNTVCVLKEHLGPVANKDPSAFEHKLLNQQEAVAVVLTERLAT